MPVAKQLQVLGTTFVTFLVLAALMIALDNRAASQGAWLRHRDRDADALAAARAGHRARRAGPGARVRRLRDSRTRFAANLDALLNGGEVRGKSLDVAQDPVTVEQLGRIRDRWTQVDAAAGRLVDNEQSLTTLAKGLDGINQGNNAILELAQQAAQQIGQGGGSLRDIEFANQLSVLSQRIAKNANALSSGEQVDPEVAFLLGKDTGTFRDVLAGLLKGSETLRLTAVRNDEARSTLAELAKRFAGYEQGVNAILQNMQRLTIAKQSAREINAESEPMLADTTSLAARFEGGGVERQLTFWGAIVFAVLAMLALVASARSTSTTPTCAPPRARTRTSATRRRSCGCSTRWATSRTATSPCRPR